MAATLPNQPPYRDCVGIVTAAELQQHQHTDGSFGPQRTPEGRIVSTIFAARSLHEAGLADHPSLGTALDFLTRTAMVGGCSIDGRQEGVLSCYTGMLARLLVGAGRHDHQLKDLGRPHRHTDGEGAWTSPQSLTYHPRPIP